jgi:hypothetical protein
MTQPDSGIDKYVDINGRCANRHSGTLHGLFSTHRTYWTLKEQVMGFPSLYGYSAPREMLPLPQALQPATGDRKNTTAVTEATKATKNS